VSITAYAAHPDPATAACNRIALLVAGSQPTYPLYVWWAVGGDWWVACWTFLSTPLFLAVPALARRDARAGRALLLVAGVANAMLATKAFGEASGVELFLIPTALIALLALRGGLRAMLIAGMLLVAALHGVYGAPWGHFSAPQYAAFLRLNAYSVAVLTVVILWTLIPPWRARR
jgi:hypothetical protein